MRQFTATEVTAVITAVMDVTAAIKAIFTAANEIIKRCREAEQCQREALRIELRVHNLVGTLESAARAFSDDIKTQKMVVELYKYLATLPSLLERCKRPAKMAQRAQQVFQTSALAESLQGAEMELETLFADLGLAMSPYIADKLHCLPDEMEATVFKVLQSALQEQERQTDRILRRVLPYMAGSSARLQGNVDWSQLVQEETVLGEGSFGIVYAARTSES